MTPLVVELYQGLRVKRATVYLMLTDMSTGDGYYTSVLEIMPVTPDEKIKKSHPNDPDLYETYYRFFLSSVTGGTLTIDYTAARLEHSILVKHHDTWYIEHDSTPEAPEPQRED